MAKIIKLTLAFSIFISLIISGAWLFTKKVSPAKSQLSSQEPKHIKKNYEPLFYRTIGGEKKLLSKSPKPSKLKDHGRYTVEIIVTTNKSRADQVVNDLKTRNIDAFYSVFNQGGRVFYKVRTGIFSSEQAANQHLGNVIDNKYKGLKVRKL